MTTKRRLRRQPHRIAEHVVARRDDVGDGDRALGFQYLGQERWVLRHIGN